MGFGPQGGDWGFKAGIQASRLRFGPQGWDLGLKAGIWASRLGYQSEGGMDGGEEEEEEGEGKNSPYVWKHRSSTPLGPPTKKDVYNKWNNTPRYT